MKGKGDKMKKLLKITSVLSIIYGVHFIALGLLALFAAGFSAVVSMATFSLSLFGGAIGMILTLAICLALAYLHGYGGICALKNNKKPALLNAAIAAVISLVFLIISLVSKKVSTSFLDVFGVILPIVQAFLIIQTED